MTLGRDGREWTESIVFHSVSMYLFISKGNPNAGKLRTSKDIVWLLERVQGARGLLVQGCATLKKSLPSL